MEFVSLKMMKLKVIYVLVIQAFLVHSVNIQLICVKMFLANLVSKLANYYWLHLFNDFFYKSVNYNY